MIKMYLIMYRIGKKDVKCAWPVARQVAKLTGKSVISHYWDCLWCGIKYGCSPSQYIDGEFYRLKSFDREKTLTKGRGYELSRLYNKSKEVCQNKVAFNGFFRQYVKRDWLYAKEASLAEIKDFIENHERVMVKPIDSAKGKGVTEWNKNNDITALCGENCLLEEIIVQHPDMCFCNRSVNTIRIVSILDNIGEVHFIRAILKSGVGDTIVDNVNAGGVEYPINIKYGRIEGGGYRGGDNSSGKYSRILVHPGTDRFMLGIKIPFWNEALLMVENAAKMLPNCRYVGWDIAITPNGPEFIEGNTRTGAQAFEYIGINRFFYQEMVSYYK